MSRSRRKTPICGLCGGTSAQKAFKKQEHSRERSHVKHLLTAERFDEAELLSPKQFGNEWDSPRDGKTYFGDMPSLKWYWIWSRCSQEEYIAESILERKKLMRK